MLQPVVFPGFSWSNMMRTRKQPPSAFNKIPRRAGKFWSYQAAGFAAMEHQPLFICKLQHFGRSKASKTQRWGHRRGDV